MRLDDVDALVIAASALVVLAVVVATLLARRAAARRMKALVVRLDPTTTDVDRRGGLERTLARLERAASAAMGGVTEASSVAQRLEQVVGLLPQGVVLCDDTGDVVLHKAVAGPPLGRAAEQRVDEVVAELLAGALRGEEAAREVDVVGPPRRLLSIVVRPLDDGWRTIGAAVVIDDVSAARQLDMTGRALVADAAALLGAPVHGLAALATLMADESDAASRARLAARIADQAGALERAVDELSALAALDAARGPAPEPVPVHLVVAEAVEGVRGAAHDAGVALEVTEPPRRLAVLGERRELALALTHVIRNAVDHSPDGAAVQVFVATDGRMVNVVVRDAGPGIAVPEQQRIFERFYRVARAPRPSSGAGLGLGLAVVREVAERSGGDVSVHSREGQGAMFTVRLPLASGPVVATAEAG